jgi:oligopeptide/dipeptide ABC transporter ATP-binding protein
MTTNNGNLLEVTDLRTYFNTEDGLVKAVDGITFRLKRGETLGIVGESGSGKSVTNLSIIRLIPTPPGEIVSGEIIFDRQDLLKLNAEDVRHIRGRRIAMIFQDPMTSLNPFMKVSRQLMEMTRLHLGHTRQQAYEHAVKMLETVGIPDARARVDNYPHEFSGGMRQRVMIAMAISCNPTLLIADEPTTALDVTIQAQILDLLRDLKQRLGMAILLITHNLGIVSDMADRVAVMYAGQIVELAPGCELLSKPLHPYTKALINSVPKLAPESAAQRLSAIPGNVPRIGHFPPGCRFYPRCPTARPECENRMPELTEVAPGKWVRCFYAGEANSTRAKPHVR